VCWWTSILPAAVRATLLTRPEEIYRALIEATAYGTRMIVETFRQNGVAIHEIVATGGLPDRNKLLMQIYADVTGLPIYIPASSFVPPSARRCTARSRRAAAGGLTASLRPATRWPDCATRATPQPENQAVYDKLYAEYVLLHDYFGRGANDVMKRLKLIKAQARNG